MITEDNLLNNLIDLISQERIIEAVVVYKNSTGIDVKKSKEFIDELKSKIPQIIENWERKQEEIIIDSNDFYKLLNKNQTYIIEIDKSYVQKFVKISIYLKSKRETILSILKTRTELKKNKSLRENILFVENFGQLLNSYNSLTFHSISMVASVMNNDLITFFEIYECFDKLNIFNTNWENEMSQKISDLGFKLDEIGFKLDLLGAKLDFLVISINNMEKNIINSLDNLSYITQKSIEDLGNSIDSQSSSINSSINFNNLLTGIQTYQVYKINQNTKSFN
jgi:hypothetical protein